MRSTSQRQPRSHTQPRSSHAARNCLRGQRTVAAGAADAIAVFLQDPARNTAIALFSTLRTC